MLRKLLFIAISCFIFTISLFSQTYRIEVKNGVYSGTKGYEFDVFIKAVSENFLLTSYQVSLNYSTTDSTKINFSYINGTSELSNIPTTGIGIFQNVNSSVLTFASLPGIDTINQNYKRIGRFSLKSDKALTGLLISWNFSGDIITILTGRNFNNITNPHFHFPQNEIHDADYVFEKSSNGNDQTTIKSFELLQNYPNPFNPATNIKYKVPSDAFIQIKVYNLLGEEVRNLVEEFQTPGVYDIKFNSESLPSGYYIYTLSADNKIIGTKKMILLK